jgi:hypothetical protein
MFNKVTAFILDTPIIGASIYRVLNYLDNRSDRKAKTVLLAAQTRSVQVITKNVLYEALAKIKKGMRADLKVNGRIRHMELQDYAVGNRAKQAETLAKAYVYHDSDLKNEIDRARMANKRIEDYRQLQNNISRRQLIRSIRKETDPDKKAKLTEEFKTKLAENPNRMVNMGVEDYRRLQNNTLQRQLIRAIRKETDPDKKAKLMEEFKTKLKENLK